MDGFDVVVRVARLALQSSGEGVETLERYVERAARSQGLTVDVLALPEQAVLTERGAGPADRVRVVREAPGVFRLDRVAGLKRVLAELDAGLSADEACRELDAVATAPPRWPWWLRVVGVALFAAGFAPSVVATWSEVFAALTLGLVTGLLLVASAGRPAEGLLPFFAAFVVTTLGVVLLPDLAGRTGITLVVLPALFVVVPGDTLSAAAGELLSGRFAAGAARLVLGAFVLGLIVVGILAAVGLTGRGDLLAETLPAPALPVAAVLAGWVVFSVGLVLAFCAEAALLAWLVPSVLATYVVQQLATRAAGEVIGTLVAGTALGVFANLVDAGARRPPRLLLLLGGFFVLTVGGVGVRGVTALVGGDVVSGLRDLVDFGLQVPTVAVALAAGVVASEPWRQRARCGPGRRTSGRSAPRWPARRSRPPGSAGRLSSRSPAAGTACRRAARRPAGSRSRRAPGRRARTRTPGRCRRGPLRSSSASGTGCRTATPRPGAPCAAAASRPAGTGRTFGPRRRSAPRVGWTCP
ncbi:MAG: threonine/serine exporter family protein [Nocardioidaceae bacterium]|nr:threonine/serine exporter family protein [Nocardioidaceae bacterium]NUS53078.1 threonine/serine exporter family protein [Nocardioidaceae bacterium]